MKKYKLYFITRYDGDFPKGIRINDFKYNICNVKEYIGSVELDEMVHLTKEMKAFDTMDGTQSTISIKLEQGIKLNQKEVLMYKFLKSLNYSCEKNHL